MTHFHQKYFRQIKYKLYYGEYMRSMLELTQFLMWNLNYKKCGSLKGVGLCQCNAEFAKN
jgi:hypothetical protein